MQCDRQAPEKVELEWNLQNATGNRAVLEQGTLPLQEKAKEWTLDRCGRRKTALASRAARQAGQTAQLVTLLRAVP